jgi:hypothetical protein
MAYVVARAAGRFEIRESVHTPKGPRARSLANFTLLTNQVLATAAGRATRDFDTQAVLASARKAGAPAAPTGAHADHREAPGTPGHTDGSYRGFVESSRRMVEVLERTLGGHRSDPGTALIDLLGFADAIVGSQPSQPFEPLAFPVLARLAKPPPAGDGPG